MKPKEEEKKKEVAKPAENAKPKPKAEKPKPKVTPTPKKKKKVVKPTPTGKVNLDKLAYAVAMQETHDCTKGYGASHNNCFGIKNYRMKSISHLCGGEYRKMCKFKSKEDAYKAFKIVWSRGYKGYIPNAYIAQRRSGHDRSAAWLKNVLYYYYK